MTPHRPCVVGFGELVWDVLPHATLPGGAPANFVWHAQQLGAAGTIVSAIGDDQAGRDLASWLRSMGLSNDAVQLAPKPTGRVDVHVGTDGEPGYRIQKGSAWDMIQWTDPLAALARRADCVCFGSLAQRSSVSRESLHRFLDATRPDCLRIFDVNLRLPAPERGVIGHTLGNTDVLKLNEEEWAFIAAEIDLDAHWSRGCPQLLQQSNVRLIALTRGAGGSVLMTEDETHDLPGEVVEISDTVGAGDAFAATLAIGLLRGMALDEIQRVAAGTAAYVCTQEGGTPRLPEHLKVPMSVPVRSVQAPKVTRRRSAGTFVLSAKLKATRDSEPAESH